MSAHDLQPEDCSFCQLSANMLRRDENRCWATAQLAFELYLELAKDAQFSIVNVPKFDVKSIADAEALAMKMRRVWDLGLTSPIPSVADVVEARAGIPVICTEMGCRDVDIFSVVRQSNALIIRATLKNSISQFRFDVLHELGHLIMHRARQAKDHLAEEQANRFAGAFLLPGGAFVQDFPSMSTVWDWGAITSLKQKYGTSFVAIIQRAYQLRIINRSVYRRGLLHVSRTWGIAEPFEPQIADTPMLIRHALAQLQRRDEFGQYMLAESLGWGVEAFERLTGLPLVRPEALDRALEVVDFTGKKKPGAE